MSTTSAGRLSIHSASTRLIALRRTLHPQVRSFSASAAHGKERLVILGSGWGGYEVLRSVDKKRWGVHATLFSFARVLIPSLKNAICAVGTLEFRCAVEPVRRYAQQATTYQAWCDKIDFDQKTLTCVPATPLPSRFERPQTISAPPASVESTEPSLQLSTLSQRVLARPRKEFKVHYNKLVVAVGCYSQTFNVPGVKEYAYFLKDVRDARAIRLRILECFEEASQPTLSDIDRRNLLNFCIVGAGPTGVEFAAELHDLIASDIKRSYGPQLARLARITLYDVASRMLGGFEKGLAEYAERKFSRDGINIKLKHHVERVEDGILHVKEQGEGSHSLPFGVLVWSTGLAPNPLVQSITNLRKDGKTGRYDFPFAWKNKGRGQETIDGLLTDDHLRTIQSDGTVNEDVWAIGDAAVIQDGLLPATAQVASQKAKYVTGVLNRLVRDRPTTDAFHFRSQGNLAYLGDWKALYDRTTVESGPKGKEAGCVGALTDFFGLSFKMSTRFPFSKTTRVASLALCLLYTHA
ncbi:hypothetical protein EW145_g6668 [Phellinidium pouzarii]|uniref:FAD/NAD(P)-binding domain-containing protein n=1 Tax=Phellinidium pouzarii TaxID=167371 RepID=A0A4S4KVV0_9AGAM|nr:hypothetical protein EW145_g6668 [Phellinidium pouzarii]